MRMRISDEHVDQFKHAEGLNTLCSLFFSVCVFISTETLKVHHRANAVEKKKGC